MYRLFTALLLLVAATTTTFAQSLLPVPSYWTNQRGSEMKIYDIDAQGNFKGVFINHAQGFACQNTPFDLTGKSIGPYVKFIVAWKNAFADCHSTTVWRGTVIDNAKMPTRWVLYSAGGRLRGVDLFTRQP